MGPNEILEWSLEYAPGNVTHVVRVTGESLEHPALFRPGLGIEVLKGHEAHHECQGPVAPYQGISGEYQDYSGVDRVADAGVGTGRDQLSRGKRLDTRRDVASQRAYSPNQDASPAGHDDAAEPADP